MVPTLNVNRNITNFFLIPSTIIPVVIVVPFVGVTPKWIYFYIMISTVNYDNRYPN